MPSSHERHTEPHGAPASNPRAPVPAEVFTWLLTWARAHSPEGLPAGVSPPELHVSQSVSILIAAHFLRMSRLVPEALSFVRQRFLQVVFLPLDLTGLADDLTAPLQASLSDDDIEAAWVLSHDSGEVARRMQAAAGLAEPPESKEVAEQGRRVRLMVNKLYRARLQALVERPGVDLTACEACGEVYSARLGSRLPCGSARMFVGFRGDVVTRHVADPAWSAQDYITALRQQRLPWRTIFWRTWAATEALWCTHCRHWYVLSQVGRCMHHREPPLFGRGKNTGVFPCCGGNAFRFGGGDAPGCSPRPHEIGPAPSDVEEGVPQGQRGGERAGAEAEAAVVSRLERFRRLIDAPLPDEAERAAGKSGGKGWESASSRGMSRREEHRAAIRSAFRTRQTYCPSIPPRFSSFPQLHHPAPPRPLPSRHSCRTRIPTRP